MDTKLKKTWVKGLLIDCPVGKPLEDCPAKDIRGLPTKERSRIVDDMTEEAVDEILDHHRRCVQEREGRQ